MKAEELREGMRFLIGDGNCVEFAGLGNKGTTVEPKIVDTEDGKIEEVTDREDLLVVDTEAGEEVVDTLNDEEPEVEPDQAMFEMFDTGVIYFCPLDQVEDAMERFKFERLHVSEWMRRIVAFHEFNVDKRGFKNYLGIYDQMLTEASDEEIKAMYDESLK